MENRQRFSSRSRLLTAASTPMAAPPDRPRSSSAGLTRRNTMNLWQSRTVGSACAVAFYGFALLIEGETAAAQSGSRVVRGINGSWEAYPQRGAGLGSSTQASIPAPAPIPEPPLKPEHLTKWKEVQS